MNLKFNPFPILQTERLVLRAFHKQDVAALFGMRTNDRVMKNLGRNKMKNIDEAKFFIQKVTDDAKNGTSVEWAISLKEKDRLIGKLGFWRIIVKHQRAELGYNLMPEFFTREIMSEAVAAILQYGFEVIKLHSVEANLDPNNTKSSNLLSRMGFSKERHFKESYFYSGVFSDTASYSLLRSDWLIRNSE